MTELARAGGHVVGFAATARSDRWWVGPFLTVLGLGGFAVYATWAALQGSYYCSGSYLSPFYSPLLFVDPSAPGSSPVEDAWLGPWPEWWPSILPASPAFLILIFPTLLAGYTFGCHSFRHLAGGKLDCFSCDGTGALRYGVWSGSSALNARHMQWAWASLFWVAFSDLYVRLVSMGVIHDFST